jgi:hypothetical protein
MPVVQVVQVGAEVHRLMLAAQQLQVKEMLEVQEVQNQLHRLQVQVVEAAAQVALDSMVVVMLEAAVVSALMLHRILAMLLNPFMVLLVVFMLVEEVLHHIMEIIQNLVAVAQDGTDKVDFTAAQLALLQIRV